MTSSRQAISSPGARHLFEAAEPEPAPVWICVRTRPRWEKRFARWLTARGFDHFLPTYSHRTRSGGKTRTTELPLLPGYVFVVGDWDKRAFVDSGAVLEVLRPRGANEAQHLHADLRRIWQAVESGAPLSLARPLEAGEWLEIRDGPLAGLVGQFEKRGRGDYLVLTVHLLHMAVAVEIPESSTTRRCV